MWPSYLKDGQNFTSSVPNSLHRTICKAGYGLRIEGEICLSRDCIACEDYEFVDDEHTCKDCEMVGKGLWPTPDRKHCQPQSDVLIPISYFLSTVGVVISVMIMVAFKRYENTRVVRNSSKEHCIIILVGMILLFLATPILQASETTALCIFVKFIVPLALSIIYSGLLAKLNRMYRIFYFKLHEKSFEKAENVELRPTYVDLRSQYKIISGLVGVQLFISIILTAYDHPDAEKLYPKRDFSLKVCTFTARTIFVSHIYNMILIFVCTYYAYHTRHLPHNYNETKYVEFAMYSTFVLWLSNILIYFATKSLRHDIKIRIYAIMLSLTGFNILLWVFIPKIYRMLCKPEDDKSEQTNKTGPQQTNKPGLEQTKETNDSQTTFTSSTSKSVVGNSEDNTSQYICSKCSTPRSGNAIARTKVTYNSSKTGHNKK